MNTRLEIGINYPRKSAIEVRDPEKRGAFQIGLFNPLPVVRKGLATLRVYSRNVTITRISKKLKEEDPTTTPRSISYTLVKPAIPDPYYPDQYDLHFSQELNPWEIAGYMITEYPEKLP